MNATDDAATEPTGGTGLGHREISMQRTALGAYLVTNIRGGQITIGGGDSADFTPVELLLTGRSCFSTLELHHVKRH